MDVPRLRERIREIGQEYGIEITAPGIRDTREETFAAINCVLLMAIYERLWLILQKIEDD